MIGPCAKTTVTCKIVSVCGEEFLGTNFCNNAQEVCPRKEGEGYEKCRTICDQAGHAESVAAGLAGQKCMGATAYIYGHTHACKDCQELLYGLGVRYISVSTEAPKDAALAAAKETT